MRRLLALALFLAGPELTAQQVYEFYHGSDLQSAELIYRSRLEIRMLASIGALSPFPSGGEWDNYTDFGKGFYTHPQSQYELAKSWAIRAAQNKCAAGQAEAKWGIVAFLTDPYELAQIRRQLSTRVLQFTSKTDAPRNAPPSQRNPGAPMTWLEFVENNRHLKPKVQRPGDEDWSGQYAWIQGPIWVPRDSGINVGLPKFEKESQLNWLTEGLEKVFNKQPYRRRLDQGTAPCRR